MGTARIDSPEEARRLLEGLGEAPGRAPGPGTALAAVEPPGASQGPARRAEPATDGQGRGEGEGKAAAEAGVPAGDRRAVEEQMAAVPAERDAEGRLTAPNGKPSGLEERLWRLARTAWFRARHGDWLTLARIGAVRELGAIPVPEAGATREQSRSMYRALGAVTAADGRRVELVNAAFGKLERHRDGARILRLVPKLRELFAAAVPAYSEKEREPDRHRNVVAYHNYVGKARIAGREYYVRFTVQEVRKADGSELHNAALSDIEMTEAAAAGVHSRIIHEAKAGGSSLDLKLAAWLGSVKAGSVGVALDGNGEPVLDAEGNPRSAAGAESAAGAGPAGPAAGERAEPGRTRTDTAGEKPGRDIPPPAPAGAPD